jgi:NADH-quinone oxidoreductase subunit K
LIPLNILLLLSLLIFSIGLAGALLRRHTVFILLSFEIMLSAVVINLAAFSAYLDPGDPRGDVLALFIMGALLSQIMLGVAIAHRVFENPDSLVLSLFKFSLGHFWERTRSVGEEKEEIEQPGQS